MKKTLYLLILCFITSFFTSSLFAAPNWTGIEKLIKDQKITQASTQIDYVLKSSRQAKDNLNWRHALILGAVMRSKRGQFAEGVKYLNQAWPKDNESQMLINLHRAYLYTSYIQNYRWEIQNREKISSRKAVPLKKQTMPQLVRVATQSFAKAYTLASTLNYSLDRYTLPLPSFKNYFVKPNYPVNIRGNIRDTITYLWVDFLQDSSIWTAQQSTKANGFSLKELLAISYRNNFGVLSGASSTVHPIKKMLWLLSDLELYQNRSNKPEAALEAFRVKIEKLSQLKSGSDDTQQLINLLKQRINKTNPALPWINMLRSQLASLIRRVDSDDANIKSVAVLKQCLAQHQKHDATAFCQVQFDEISKPALQLTTMKTDGLKKRSLLINHKNINQVYFRAWRIALPQLLKNDPRQLMDSLIAKNSRKPDAVWSSNVVDKKDYKLHKTFVVPPLHQYGYWYIAASNDAGFSVKNKTTNIVTSALNLSRFVADIQTGGSLKAGNTININVYNGETGHVANKVAVELWTEGYNAHPSRLISRAITSPQGKASFKVKQQNSYRLLLKYNNDFTVVDNVYAYPREYNSVTPKSSLIFTDRAIYRPSQTIKWKVVAYQGNHKTGKFNVFVNNPGWVKLLDANGKVVRQVTVRTNRYGSASGEFVAKAGLLLGNWRIATSWGGGKSIKVEEYKRPTFSVKITGSKQELAINKPAKIDGRAKYYFGQAITDGIVKWRVKRQQIPLWGYGGHGYLKARIIASGKSKVDASGNFSINFVPKSAKLKQLQGLKKSPTQYHFTVTADFTDSGGETRTATRNFSIGTVGVAASITKQQAFGIAGKPYKIEVRRHDANGAPRTGSAFWELFQVAQPGQAQMPADQPLSEAQKPKSRFASKGDFLKPRWSSSYSSSADVENFISDWKVARKIQQGTLRHDDLGNAKIDLKGLGAGLYRLRYTTKDHWGQVYKTDSSFIIAFQDKTTVRVPLLLKVQDSSVEVGDKVSYLVGSGFKQTPVLLEIYHGNDLLKRTIQRGGIKQLDFPVNAEHRGGLTFVSTIVKDYQLIRQRHFVNIPWSNKNLNVAFSTFRNKLQPGQKEKWRVTVKNSKGQPVEKGAVEVLASMYDRTLDLFASHSPVNIASLYAQSSLSLDWRNNLGIGEQLYNKTSYIKSRAKSYQPAQLKLLGGISGQFAMAEYAGMAPTTALPSPMRRAPQMRRTARYSAPRVQASVDVRALSEKHKSENDSNAENKIQQASYDSLDSIKTRSNFNETAFFYPHLVLDDDGSVAFEFEVPESLTQWKVWVSAISRDLRGGSITKFARTSKELMVRPYLPRFLRAGDHAYIDVLINNASSKTLTGKLDFDVLDAMTLKTIATDFKLTNNKRDFTVAAGKSSKLRFSIIAPKELGMVAIRARASANSLGDGEQRPMPILPSRIHLTQSRFAALQGNMSRDLQFKQLAQNNDPTRINDKLVVTVDGQLFYSTLNALPYLVKYPYECTEQTMNRFLSTSIVNSVFKRHPAIASMATKLAKRDTQLAKWDQIDKDPNRKMLLEETPWLNDAQGGKQSMDELIRILDPKIAKQQSQKSLLKLRKAQTASGGFPWWEGGRESVYMTAYLLHGFSRALEFKVDIPKEMVQKAWRFLGKHYDKYYKDHKKLNANLYEVTLINYVLSSYPDVSWAGGAFNAQDRKTMLDISFNNWRKLPALLKAYAALTLKRAGRTQDAQLIFDALMDSAKTDQDLGTYWMPEDRSWLWYNDRVDTHAFMLRTMMELNPADERRHGLVQWLMLNKKLNHWKSTRATAESIYSLVHYLKKENQLGLKERATINIGNLLNKTVVFKPNEYTGKAQLVVEGDKIKPAMANISVTNQSKSLMFASATWHFSTDRLPKSAQGDFFNVSRRFFKRVQKGQQWELQPLQEGAQIQVGDQLEIQLSLRAKHAAEFVHLRAPRGAGFEPIEQTSGYRWDTGIGYYEEIRDSGANYFFERLPAGEYSFKYRLRATTAGEFRVAPASVQSIYAPEFNAYSSGKRLLIK